MVSFTVTLIMMAVITLIVVGFTQVARRNSREALDRQLSAQAFYAAESGINVTSKSIVDYLQANPTGILKDKTNCAQEYDPVNGSGANLTPLSSQNNVAYTCVLVDPTPQSLSFANVTTNGSQVVPITTPSQLKSLTFTWSRQNGQTGTACSGTYNAFPASSAWGCAVGMLRVDIVENPSANLGNLDTHTDTLYLTPYGSHNGQLNGAGNIAFTGAPTSTGYIGMGCNMTNPQAVPPTCANSNPCTTACSVTVRLPANSSSYMVRLSAIYRNPETVTISGQLTDNSAATFVGGQAVIDVTGKAQDELRRVQTRLALTGSTSDVPIFALGSGADICKHFSILPADTVTPSGTCN